MIRTIRAFGTCSTSCLSISLLLLPFTGWAQTVTNVTYDSVSHGSIRIDFLTSAGWKYGHIRYLDKTLNPAKDCTDGVSGSIEPNSYSGGSTAEWGSFQMSIGGLTPGHSYQFCPEVGNTNDRYSSGGKSVTVTLPAAPAEDPAPPISPAAFSVMYPPDMGKYISVTVGAGACASGFYKCLYAAIANQCKNGTIINLPAGVSASSLNAVGPWGGEGAWPNSCDIVAFDSKQVNTSSARTNANSISVSGHGFTEGSQAVFGVEYGCLPGDYTANPSHCKEAGNNRPIPFPRAIPLFVHVIDSNTFQLYTCPGPTNGTARACPFSPERLITFADAGGGKMHYAKWPRKLHWVIVRTSTPDAMFVPPGSLVQGKPDGSGVPTAPTEWAPLMGNLQVAPNAGKTMLILGDMNTDPMTSNIMFVGIHASYTDTTEPSVSGDPIEAGQFYSSDWNTSDIWWDRCWMDAPQTSFRTVSMMDWNGARTAVVNSYLGTATLWHQTISGLAISANGRGASVAKGTTYAGKPYALASPASISLAGKAISGDHHRIFLDFSLAGKLNVVAPPGVTARVSGVANTHVVSVNQSGIGTSFGPGIYSAGTSELTFPTKREPDFYYIDPIVSAASNCSNTRSLYESSQAAVQIPATSAGSFDLGLTFTNDADQYLCGFRFLKLAAETRNTHSFALWSTNGALLARAATTRETAHGWQSAMLSSAYHMTAGTSYVAGYHVNSAAATGHLQFRNSDYYNANMHVSGAYVDSNGNGSYADMWPLDYMGRAAVVLLGYIDIDSSGTVVGAGNASVGDGGNFAGASIMPTSGLGPGPFLLENNFLGCAGLCVHFDDSGGRFALRGDYTLIRNYFYGPHYSFYGAAGSDGMEYVWRQLLEWKGGERQRIYGNIFDGSEFETGSHSMIALQSPQEVPCMTDTDIMWNTFKHGPGAISGGLEYGNGEVKHPMSCPPVRLRISQNIGWDLGPYRVGGDDLGQFWSGSSLEDFIYTHNTVFSSGIEPWFYSLSEHHQEGARIEDNIFPVDAHGGMGFDANSLFPKDPCTDLKGKAVADCKLTPNYLLRKNVLMPINGSNPQQVQRFFPTPLNQVLSPGSPEELAFQKISRSLSLTSTEPDFHWKLPNLHPGEAGADVDKLRAVQGRVNLLSANASGPTAATITIEQPDSGTCTLDYGTEPSVTKFTRLTQACNPGRITFTITGLHEQTSYFWRYNGAVQTPMGELKTP